MKKRLRATVQDVYVAARELLEIVRWDIDWGLILTLAFYLSLAMLPLIVCGGL